MPGGTGFDLLTQLDRVPRIVFTTAYDQYAVKAFDVNALDYLLKPIEPERLATALRKIQAAPPPRRGRGRAARATVHPRRAALLVRAAAGGEPVHLRRQLRAPALGQGAAVARAVARCARGEAGSGTSSARTAARSSTWISSSRWKPAKAAGCTCSCGTDRKSKSPAGRQRLFRARTTA